MKKKREGGQVNSAEKKTWKGRRSTSSFEGGKRTTPIEGISSVELQKKEGSLCEKESALRLNQKAKETTSKQESETAHGVKQKKEEGKKTLPSRGKFWIHKRGRRRTRGGGSNRSKVRPLSS